MKIIIYLYICIILIFPQAFADLWLTFFHGIKKKKKKLITLYFKVSLLQCIYTFKFWVILFNYMYLLYG